MVLWLVGFDIIYALQDYEFDKSHGLHSLVVAWGPKNALAAAFLAHMIMCGLLLAFGLLCGFRLAYLVGWFLIVGCLVLEHWIARRRSLNWINLAFFRLNASSAPFSDRGGGSDFSGRVQAAVKREHSTLNIQLPTSKIRALHSMLSVECSMFRFSNISVTSVVICF